MRYIVFNLILIFFGWIAFTFFSANVSERFGGKIFADFNEGIVEVGSDTIPGFNHLVELGYLNWLIPRVIQEKYESPNHKKIFNMMIADNSRYKSKNIKEIMADLNLEDFNDLNSLTKEIPYEFNVKEQNKNIKGVIETLKSHQKNPNNKVLTLTCSDKNEVYNFVFMDNKAILTKSLNYRKINATETEPKILGGFYKFKESKSGNFHSYIYLTNFTEDKNSTDPEFKHLNHNYYFILYKTSNNNRYYFNYKKSIKMGKWPKLDFSNDIKYPYCE